MTSTDDLERRLDDIEGDRDGLTNDELADLWRNALDPDTPDRDEFESREAYINSVLGEGTMTSRRDLESRINDLSGRSSIEDMSDGELWDAYQATVSPGEPNPVNGSEAYIEMLKRGEERKQ